MTTLSQGSLDGTGLKIAIVVSRFSGEPCQRLLDGTLERLIELGATEQNIDVTSVPGAFEIPIVAAELSRGRPRKYDAIITLGCIIRGETPHFDFVAGPCAEALMKLQSCASPSVALQQPPIIFGVLTTDHRDQALARCGGDRGHKGRDCAESAIEMAQLLKKIRSSSS
ncbi:MAG: 6,7-dimethyl-8-ribityllumazine synthase [Planctomycetota bacterium]|nr:6,7-dimethyl-8-ribityllumazine synthase [Planctomycetota bacterium]